MMIMWPVILYSPMWENSCLGGLNFVQAANFSKLKAQEVSRCLAFNWVVVPNHKCLTTLPQQITFKIDIYFQTKPVALWNCWLVRGKKNDLMRLKNIWSPVAKAESLPVTITRLSSANFSSHTVEFASVCMALFVLVVRKLPLKNTLY